jgi:thymidylate synthase
MNPMEHNLISNFSDFSYSLNEGNSYKKNFGILGPFEKWGYKMKSCCPEMGGEADSNSVIASDVSSDIPNLCLKYIYGDNQESDPIYFPKDAFIVSGDSKNPIIETKPGVRFWDSEENQSNLDEFINAFIESKHFQSPEEDPSGDIDVVLEILGIDSPIEEITMKKNLHWIAKLEDGTEVELKKKDAEDFLNTLKFYFNSDSYSPEVEVYRDKPGFETVFNTPKGKFIRKTEKLTDLSKDPVHQYLFNASLKKDPSLYQEPVINYLNSILKSHDWRPESSKQMDSFTEKGKEIDQLKKILSNTLTEENLDELYAKARERYSIVSNPKGN